MSNYTVSIEQLKQIEQIEQLEQLWRNSIKKVPIGSAKANKHKRKIS